MTSKKRHFVSLDEIVALQLECCDPKCQARVTLGPDRWEKERLPNKCPSCGTVWWFTGSPHNSPSVENAIHGFLENSQKLVGILGNEKRTDEGEFFKLGCNLTLEIKSEPEEDIS
jgi:hypothetical protein